MIIWYYYIGELLWTETPNDHIPTIYTLYTHGESAGQVSIDNTPWWTKPKTTTRETLERSDFTRFFFFFRFIRILLPYNNIKYYTITRRGGRTPGWTTHIDRRWKRLAAARFCPPGTWRAIAAAVTPTTGYRPPELQGGHPRRRALVPAAQVSATTCHSLTLIISTYLFPYLSIYLYLYLFLSVSLVDGLLL